jgi:uncharacterized protein (TIGR03066 family)
MRRAALLVAVMLLAGAAVFVAATYWAPVPRDLPKTTAEKLVGTWKLIEADRPPGEPVPDATIEFTKDGKVTFRIVRGKGKSPILTGTYKLVGKELHTTYESGAEDDHERYWVTTIRELTADTLITGTQRRGPRGGETRGEYRRLETM